MFMYLITYFKRTGLSKVFYLEVGCFGASGILIYGAPQLHNLDSVEYSPPFIRFLTHPSHFPSYKQSIKKQIKTLS